MMAIIRRDVATGRVIKRAEGFMVTTPPYGPPPKPPPKPPPPRPPRLPRPAVTALEQSEDSELAFWNRQRLTVGPLWPLQYLAMSSEQALVMAARRAAR